MLTAVRFFLTLRANRRGVTSLEYGLIAGVIVAVIAVGFSMMSNQLSNKFSDVGTCVSMDVNDPSYASTCGNGP